MTDNSDKDGYSPLTLAVKDGDVDAVNHLVDQGAEVNSMDRNGVTPLEGAVSTHNVAMIRALAKLGADLNTRDNEGVTLVYAAAREGHACGSN